MYKTSELLLALDKANQEIEQLTSSREQLQDKHTVLLLEYLNLQDEVTDLLRFKLAILEGLK
jgi:hypothetical protein